jgi:hypothetical protein
MPPLAAFASTLRFSLLALAFAAFSTNTFAAPKITEGAYRVDWNRKVRDLCVDNYTNDDLTARDWQGVLAALGSICTLSNVREGKTEASWTGKCSQPGVGKVLDVKYDVSVKVNADGSFDILTVISGDQQARIPIHGERLKGAAAVCSKEQSFFRPWQ